MDNQQVLAVSAMVPSTLLVGAHITEFVDKLSVINSEAQMVSTPLRLLMSPILKELTSHMAVHDHIYEQWLQISVKLIVSVHVKVARVLRLLLEIITTVNQDIVALVTLPQSYTAVTLSGMVHSVRVKVIAAALLHGSLWI